MKNSFIEVYDNALPSDICDYLISLFERESKMGIMSGVTESQNNPWRVKEVRTMIDPTEGDTNYVSALDMTLYSQNYMYDSVIGDLDYILFEKMFEYNEKYHVLSSKLNADLVPDDEKKEDNSFNDIYRHGDYVVKKYRYPDDGYYAWHTDWGAMPEFIGRVLAAQFYLNDVEKGGETEFYHQKLKIKPKKGSLVIWPVGFTHTHRGNNPKSGDKYVVSSWLTQRNIFR